MSPETDARIVILAGGLSPERDVSVRSGRRVAEALRRTGRQVDVLDADASLLPSLAADRPSCVVPLLHGAPGEDGAIRGVLDALGLPYVGSDPVACRTSFDKPIASARIAAAGLAVPAQFVLAATTFRELGAAAVLEAVVGRLGLPLMVKPTRGGSSLGATVVRSGDDLPAAMMAAFAYGDTALVEQFVTGTEVAVSVLDDGDGPRALPVVEIVADGGVYDYAARYHWSRSDLIVDAEGTPWFLEVNVAPGMTETSTFPQAISAAGLDLGTVVADLISRT